MREAVMFAGATRLWLTALSTLALVVASCGDAMGSLQVEPLQFDSNELVDSAAASNQPVRPRTPPAAVVVDLQSVLAVAWEPALAGIGSLASAPGAPNSPAALSVATPTLFNMGPESQVCDPLGRRITSPPPRDLLRPPQQVGCLSAQVCAE
ncbi:MAG: hypothetical protein CMJ58_24615 [Planctomycetaceae bacterium]|nr:hypothetical protein [Planctomycetaceae bacterium]